MATFANGLFLPSLLILSFLLSSSHASISLWREKKNRLKNAGEVLGITDYDPRKVKQVATKPRLYLYEKFLSDEECDHLIELAKNKMEYSMVADNESGKSVKSKVRTSSGHFLRKRQDEVVARIERRIAAWTFLPEENGESIHVLHYELGQKYDSHYDYFHDKYNQQLGGHRYATVLMYLADTKRGGETIFPNVEGHHQIKDDTYTDCAKEGVAVKPRKGDTVLFFSLYPNATTDTHSLHGSCPVEEGDKWAATKWIHVRSFERRPVAPTETTKSEGEAGCVDANELCSYWASRGECTKNPEYMVGTQQVLGSCRKSCNVCSVAESS